MAVTRRVLSPAVVWGVCVAVVIGYLVLLVNYDYGCGAAGPIVFFGLPLVVSLFGDFIVARAAYRDETSWTQAILLLALSSPIVGFLSLGLLWELVVPCDFG